MSEDRMVTVNWITAFLDTPLATSHATEMFWLNATGTSASARRGDHQQFVTLLPPVGDAFLRVQVTDSNTCGVHVDLHVPDVIAATDLARSLDAQITSDHGTHVILHSPGGLPFCLVANRSEHVRPQPASWPPGHHSLLDQVCLDIAEDRYVPEAQFWSAMTQWPQRPGSRPEFDYLDRPRDIPLRVLLQRVGGSGPTRAHLDLACDDIPAETARHQSLGAQVVRQATAWTTLRDPSHREYCITSRDPWTGTIAR
jgi:Glyoxalase-like domain